MTPVRNIEKLILAFRPNVFPLIALAGECHEALSVSALNAGKSRWVEKEGKAPSLGFSNLHCTA